MIMRQAAAHAHRDSESVACRSAGTVTVTPAGRTVQVARRRPRPVWVVRLGLGPAADRRTSDSENG